MGRALPLQSELTERVLVGEREAVVAWLEDLESRVHYGEHRYERVLQLRRIVGKLDNRIRLIRDLEQRRQTRESEARSV